MTIGKRLLHARKIKGYTQEALASEIGVSRGVIFNIEKQKIDEPQTIVVDAICKVLSINKKWLLTGTGPMEPANESSEILAELERECATLTATEIKYLLQTIRVMKQFEADLQDEITQEPPRPFDEVLADCKARAGQPTYSGKAKDREI